MGGARVGPQEMELDQMHHRAEGHRLKTKEFEAAGLCKADGLWTGADLPMACSETKILCKVSPVQPKPTLFPPFWMGWGWGWESTDSGTMIRTGGRQADNQGIGAASSSTTGMHAETRN